jgi:hypothetical protein
MGLRALSLGLLLSVLPVVLVACRWEKGKIGGPAFKKKSQQVAVRARGGPITDGGLELSLVDGSLTRVSTAVGLDECRWAFRVRIVNQTDATNERLRGPALALLAVDGRSRTLSGPYGCEPTLAPGAACAGSFATNLPPSQCQDPAALLFGAARLDVSF